MSLFNVVEFFECLFTSFFHRVPMPYELGLRVEDEAVWDSLYAELLRQLTNIACLIQADVQLFHDGYFLNHF